MHVDDERLAAYVLGMDASGVGKPVVSVDDVVFLLASDDACHDGVVVDFLLQVFGIASGELDATQIIGHAVVEVRIDVVAQFVIEFGLHFCAQALLYVVVVHVAPNDGRLIEADDVHKTLVLVAPRLRQTKSDMHIRLGCESLGDAITCCAKTSEDVRGKFPSEH